MHWWRFFSLRLNFMIDLGRWFLEWPSIEGREFSWIGKYFLGKNFCGHFWSLSSLESILFEYLYDFYVWGPIYRAQEVKNYENLIVLLHFCLLNLFIVSFMTTNEEKGYARRNFFGPSWGTFRRCFVCLFYSSSASTTERNFLQSSPI